VATSAGLNARTIYGGIGSNKYLLETTGCGAAFYDYDHDGWLDIFLVNGWRLEGFAKNSEPTCHLFKNNRDGTFTDVTARAGLTRSGWGRAVVWATTTTMDSTTCSSPTTARMRSSITTATAPSPMSPPKAGLKQAATRWNSGCAFLDYDRDGHLDLFVANYIDLDLKTAPLPESGPCTYKGIMVACGPPGLAAGKNLLYHNNGDGTFADVSEKSGMWNTIGNYALSVAVSDLDDDGWPDIYVANDSTAATLYQNQKDGTFKRRCHRGGCGALTRWKTAAGMGVSIGDYDRDGKLDIVKTNFAGDTDSLYANLGDGSFQDRTYSAGLGINTRYLGWGVGFLDMDNDGWLDILVTNGHVYPEVSSSKTEAPYAERKYLYRNLRNGRFEDVSDKGGPGITTAVAGRGCAFGDYDNDGDIDVIVNCVNSLPQLLRCDSQWKRSWIKVKAIGVKSNRTAIGAKVRVLAKTQKGSADPLLQVDEVRSGGSYYSQSDLRLHFGLDQAQIVDSLEVRWPSGHVDIFRNLAVNHLYVITEGAKDPQSVVIGH